MSPLGTTRRFVATQQYASNGYQLEEIYHLLPETIARAGEDDEAAMRTCDEERFLCLDRQRPDLPDAYRKSFTIGLAR